VGPCLGAALKKYFVELTDFALKMGGLEKFYYKLIATESAIL
jgi:hypothetical protein